MLFNSYAFFALLMFAFPLYYLLNAKGRYIYLLMCGAIFFGSFLHLIIFLFSVIGNAFGALILQKLRTEEKSPKYFFYLLVLLNILYLSYFKYLFTGLMPLAISFYTFEQITFLSYISFSEKSKKSPFSLRDYLLFIAFFPRLLAGPIYYYEEYKDKLQRMLTLTIPWEDIGRGFAIFSLGLFKKVICADRMALIVDPFYVNPEIFSTVDTWFVTLAYSLQIYFDFSAYSEMALGLGMMLGVTLPLNFNSPYKATSIIDFWTRWHMTLSRFIKDYVYIPLGGNESNKTRNILLTMSIAGLWHGSSLNFLAWGGLHGLLIGSNHILRRYCSSFTIPSSLKVLTVFILINTTWILFRAPSFKNAYLVFQQYVGFSSVTGFHFSKWDVIITLFFLAGIFTLPNINDLFFKGHYIRFKESILWGALCLFSFFYAYTNLKHETPFIYFNF